VTYRVSLRSPVPVDHLELVVNGRVVKSFVPTGDRRTFDGDGTIPLETSGWLLLRAWNEGSDPGVLDLYPYGTTNPIWLELPKPAPPAIEDARYFVAWLDRVIAAARARDDYNTVAEKNATLSYLNAARTRYLELAEGSS
jgi:TolB protein